MFTELLQLEPIHPDPLQPLKPRGSGDALPPGARENAHRTVQSFQSRLADIRAKQALVGPGSRAMQLKLEAMEMMRDPGVLHAEAVIRREWEAQCAEQGAAEVARRDRERHMKAEAAVQAARESKLNVVRSRCAGLRQELSQQASRLQQLQQEVEVAERARHESDQRHTRELFSAKADTEAFMKTASKLEQAAHASLSGAEQVEEEVLNETSQLSRNKMLQVEEQSELRCARSDRDRLSRRLELLRRQSEELSASAVTESQAFTVEEAELQQRNSEVESIRQSLSWKIGDLEAERFRLTEQVQLSEKSFDERYASIFGILGNPALTADAVVN